MKTTMTLLAAMLCAAAMTAAQGNDDLQHWLHLCEKPRLAYWDELCARGRAAQPAAARDEPPAAQPCEQQTPQAQAESPRPRGKN